MPISKDKEKKTIIIQKKTKTYRYVGIDKKNNRLAGELTAGSLAQARKLLIKQDINIINIQQSKKNFFSFSESKSEKKIKTVDITVLTRQLATMLAAGLPLVQALTVISDSSPGSALAMIARKIRLSLEEGNSLANSLKKDPQWFDDLFCSLVESGEQSGTLEVMLDRLATYKEKTESLKRKVKKAMYYPIAVLVVALIVSCILLIKVVPTFENLFKSFNAKLPEFTQFVLDISTALRQHGLMIILISVALFFALRKWYQNSLSLQFFQQRMILKMPVIGSILQKTLVARFTRTLSTTIAAGVPLIDSLDSIANACGNIVYAIAIRKIKDGIAMGQQMKTVMRKTNVFPIIVVQMVGIGEESGSLDAMLAKVAAIYEDEVDTAVDGLTTLLEPIIMVFLGIIVGGLVIAMYLPIFKLGSVV